MSKKTLGETLIEGMTEALAFVQGEKTGARVHIVNAKRKGVEFDTFEKSNSPEFERIKSFNRNKADE